MEKAGGSSASGITDYIALERCLWFISLDTCSTIYVFMVFLSHVIGFLMALLITTQCFKRFVKTQRLTTQQRREGRRGPISGDRAEGDQQDEGVNAPQEGEERRRESSVLYTMVEGANLTDPYVLGLLSYNLLMAIICVFAESAISNKKAELFKICTAIITFGNILAVVITSATTVEQCRMRKFANSILKFLPVVITCYGTLVLWSYTKILDDIACSMA